MTKVQLLFVLIMAGLAACRGGGELKCDDGGRYLSASETPRVRAPEDLDELDRLREMPLPEVSPRSEHSTDGGCLDAPPRIGNEL